MADPYIDPDHIDIGILHFMIKNKKFLFLMKGKIFKKSSPTLLANQKKLINHMKKALIDILEALLKNQIQQK